MQIINLQNLLNFATSIFIKQNAWKCFYFCVYVIYFNEFKLFFLNNTLISHLII